MRISEIIEATGRPVVTIEDGNSVEAAISKMAERGSSSLIVLRGHSPAGIFTEHDIVKAFATAQGKSFSQMPVERTMTNKLIVATPDDELDSSISLMLSADIRHLPVVEGGVISAILHLCDLVHYKVEVLSSEIRYLEDYVKDLHGAITD